MTFRHYFVSGHVNRISPLKVPEGHFYDLGGACATSCVAGRIEKAGASRSHYNHKRKQPQDEASNARKDGGEEEKGLTEDELVGWYH